MALIDLYYNTRRWILRTFVPEFYWPETANCNGAIIKIRNTPYTFGVRRAVCNDVYERAERALVSQYVKPGMQVLEMGGSVGIVTAVIAHCVGPTGRVVSVEASPRLANYSKTWLEDGKPVKVVIGYAFPVWEMPPDLQIQGFANEEVSLGGRVEFGYSNSGTATATKPAAPKATGDTPRSYDISTLCREYNLQPEVLVMDIEASEAVMLRQKPNMPPSIKTIIIELHEWLYPNGKTDLQKILDVLAAEGFVTKQQVSHNWLLQR